jgi:Glyoxalase/Bleomycin resistance protein/Dioxygenase superfamily
MTTSGSATAPRWPSHADRRDDALDFDLVEDSPARTTVGGRPERWVVVRPPGTETGLLLTRAEGPEQEAAIGHQSAGRVGFFLDVDDFTATHRQMLAAGVTFLGPPRAEPYGQVAVFVDVAGNRWDLRGPTRADRTAHLPKGRTIT